MSADATAESAAVSSSPVVAADEEDLLPASDAAASSSSWGGMHVAIRALGVLSAAKAGLRLAPAIIDGASAMAASGAENIIHYTRRGVEVSSETIRSGVVIAGEAAASRLDALSAGAADPEAQAKYANWSQTARWTSDVLDRGLERGSDIMETHILSAVNTVAQGSLKITNFSLKTSLRGTHAILAAADSGTKWALRANGVDLEDLEEASEHEKMVDCVLKIISELQTLNRSLSDVSTTELISCLTTYARLVDTVESQGLFASRRPVLPEYLAAITDERKQAARRDEQESRSDPLPPEEERLPLAPTPTSSDKKKKGWFSRWWHSSKATSEEDTPMSAESDPGSSPSPASPSSDPSAHHAPSYEEGLYALAGSGMTKVSRAMLFAGCAYGPRFLRFLGLPTRASTHESFLVEQCNIQPADLLLSDFTSSLAHPGFCIVRDTQLKQIVLAIRGSSAVHDALTDLTCGFSKHVSGEFGTKGYAEGSCHEGMLQSAQWFAANVRKPVLEALRDNPGYSFTITGHSLGGGVGSLLVLLWLHDAEMNPPARRIQAYFFGSPCVVSPELAHLGYGYISNFVLGHDAVCRLSRGAVEDLCGVVHTLTTDSRAESALLKLPSKERRVRRAEADARKAQHDAANSATHTHPACADHRLLAKLLDEYQARLDEKKKREEQEASGELPASDLSVSESATAAASSSSSADAPSLASLLDDLTSILRYLRRSMVHEKLFPLGHIFHLLPRDETDEEELQNEEDAKEEEKAAEERRAQTEAEGQTQDKSSSPTASSDSAASSSWRQKQASVARKRGRMKTLHEMIGAEAGQVRAAAIGEGVLGSVAEGAASSASASAPTAEQMNASPVPAVAPAVVMRPRPALPIAMPIARPHAPESQKKQRVSSPPLPIALPVGAAAVAAAAPVDSSKDIDMASPSVSPAPPAAAASAEPGASSAQSAAGNAPAASVASALPIEPAAFRLPLAAPVPVPAAVVPEPEPVENVFTNPPPFDLFAGHWSDLTDLVLSAQMIQHHLPGAYFVALATHATTKHQAKRAREAQRRAAAAAAAERGQASKQP